MLMGNVTVKTGLSSSRKEAHVKSAHPINYTLVKHVSVGQDTIVMQMRSVCLVLFKYVGLMRFMITFMVFVSVLVALTRLTEGALGSLIVHSILCGMGINVSVDRDILDSRMDVRQ
jgi:sorbitol-specific phosphotransferase system component IIBC